MSGQNGVPVGKMASNIGIAKREMNGIWDKKIVTNAQTLRTIVTISVKTLKDLTFAVAGKDIRQMEAAVLVCIS